MLIATDVSYAYPASKAGEAGREALRGVSLSVAVGERVCVLGLNGSGKSTLARLFAQDLPPAAGTFELDGEALGGEPVPAIGYVGQDPRSQLVSSTVWDEVAFGPCCLGLEPDEVRVRVHEAIERVGLGGLERRGIDELSGGQQQRLALAGVLAMRPRYLILDEVTTQLDGFATQGIRELVSSLVGDGMGMLEVSHSFEDVIGATRVVVMSGGAIAWRGLPEDLIADADALETAGLSGDPMTRIARLMLSRGYELKAPADLDDLARYARLFGFENDVRDILNDAMAERHAAGTAKIGSSSGKSAPTYAKTANASRTAHDGIFLDHITVGFGDVTAVQDASLEVAPGSICLLLGSTGSGKTTLCRVAAGLLKPDSGTAALNGVPVEAGQVGYAYQRSEDQLFCDTVYDDIAFGPRNAGLADDEVRRRVQDACELLGIGEDMLKTSPFALSGGQRRRVALAGVVAQHAGAYVLDEPTAGLDGPSRASLHLVARTLADDGCPVLIVTHDVDEWLPWADQIALMNEGSLSGCWNASDIASASIAFEGAGLRPPVTVRLREALDGR